MHVYIDDSGDGGFKVGKGSTSHLIMSACIFRTPADLTRTVDLIDQCAADRKLTKEFKYSERSEDSRDLFFQSVTEAKFHIRTTHKPSRATRFGCS
jgi:hypothetical protein